MAQNTPLSSAGSTESVPDSVLLGVYLSSRVIRIGTVSDDGRLLSFRRESYYDHAGRPESGPALADHLKSLITATEQASPAPVKAIGVGVPGLVNHATRRIVSVTNAPSLVDVDLFREFEREFKVPIDFDNNANASAYAEMASGVAKGVGDWLYLSIGTGIGAGLVLDGKLRRGKSGYAGEVGHMNIDPDGDQCACGSFGCLETKASAPNIVRRTRTRLRRDATSWLSRFRAEDLTYEHIIEAAQQGDDLARLMMQRTGHFLGMAVADLINVLNFSMVVIGGAPAARPFLVPAITEEARRRAFGPAFEDCQIVAAQLGEEAGVIGSALLAGKLLARA
ncbi:MAG TPA: ROK family protein [Blastocatellia bacterium]|nr:ROK family protein [Blastocatellia bacterium]